MISFQIIKAALCLKLWARTSTLFQNYNLKNLNLKYRFHLSNKKHFGNKKSVHLEVNCMKNSPYYLLYSIIL